MSISNATPSHNSIPAKQNLIELGFEGIARSSQVTVSQQENTKVQTVVKENVPVKTVKAVSSTVPMQSYMVEVEDEDDSKLGGNYSKYLQNRDSFAPGIPKSERLSPKQTEITGGSEHQDMMQCTINKFDSLVIEEGRRPKSFKSNRPSLQDPISESDVKTNGSYTLIDQQFKTLMHL